MTHNEAMTRGGCNDTTTTTTTIYSLVDRTILLTMATMLHGALLELVREEVRLLLHGRR